MVINDTSLSISVLAITLILQNHCLFMAFSCLTLIKQVNENIVMYNTSYLILHKEAFQISFLVFVVVRLHYKNNLSQCIVMQCTDYRVAHVLLGTPGAT